jgi:hypothetical protein
MDREWHQHSGSRTCDQCGQLCPSPDGWDELIRFALSLEKARHDIVTKAICLGELWRISSVCCDFHRALTP